MKAGTVIKIEIGKTKVIKTKTNPDCSVTEYWLNGGEKREVTICPAKYATDDYIMELILRDVAGNIWK